MTTVRRAYVSRLAGLTVFDPNGDRVGKVRDVVVALRVGTAPPRVLGLVVEVVARRRIFVPMGRVTAIDPGAVMLTTGTLNLKHFEQRAGETLVLGELLDRRVTIDRGRPARRTSSTPAMEQTRTGDWVLSRLAVARSPAGSAAAGSCTRSPGTRSPGSSLPQTGQGAETLIATYRELNAADLAHALQELPVKRRHEVAEALDDEPAGRRPRRAARGRADRHPGHAGRGPRRRRPGGDGPRRRRRPARRAVQRRPQPAARAHGARRGRAGAPAAASTPRTPPAG